VLLLQLLPQRFRGVFGRHNGLACILWRRLLTSWIKAVRLNSIRVGALQWVVEGSGMCRPVVCCLLNILFRRAVVASDEAVSF
jgi:hypothetical protein